MSLISSRYRAAMLFTGIVYLFVPSPSLHAQPSNEDCAGALPLTDGTTAFDTTGAVTGTNLSGFCNPSSGGNDAINRSVWFTYSATVTGLLIVDTIGSGEDTRLAGYGPGGCAAIPGSVLACDDDTGSGNQPPWDALISFPIEAGNTYWIEVGGFAPSPDVGAGVLNVATMPFESSFVRGRCNFDLGFDIGDPIWLLAELFSGGPVGQCDDACDANDDGTKDIADSVYMLAALFSMAGLPPAPMNTCGFDTSDDSLHCKSLVVGCPAATFSQDFEDDALGTYGLPELGRSWASPPWDNGVDEQRVSVISSAEPGRGRVLRVEYPQNTFGTSAGGAQWLVDLRGSYEELYCAYWIRFRPGFDFVLGGKIPGLAGGAANTGGNPPNGTDGWTTRMMWRENGQVTQYVYHPDQPGTFGEYFFWNLGGQRFFVPGQWHSVEHRVVMNTPGQNDGILECWFDGQLALSVTNLRYRDIPTLTIDKFYFSTFFGGGDSSWATTANETIDFDRFIISPVPITHE